MSFFWNLILLLDSFYIYTWRNYFLFPFIGLAFLATVPRLVRLFVTWR